MKISQEAREAAQNLWQDMQDMGLVSALPLACGSGDFLLHAMQCLINSTLERAAEVAYFTCAETRHVTLGDKAATAIRQIIEE